MINQLDIETPLMSPGVEQYYKIKIQDLQAVVSLKAQNKRRLEAQRNELNAKGLNKYKKNYK